MLTGIISWGHQLPSHGPIFHAATETFATSWRLDSLSSSTHFAHFRPSRLILRASTFFPLPPPAFLTHYLGAIEEIFYFITTFCCFFFFVNLFCSRNFYSFFLKFFFLHSDTTEHEKLFSFLLQLSFTHTGNILN